ncbi:MAG: hypothetical protein COB09_18985 [Thalassobium sp.]|nr:MAG: hypothetical protein COB09_18985 [Thalassobium sp.]
MTILEQMQKIKFGKQSNETILGIFLSKNWDNFVSLIHRNKTLERQNTDLQAANTKHRLENRGLKKGLKDCLECILMPDNGVSDVIWYGDFESLAEHIAGVLDEDIDFEEVAASVQNRKIQYRCPKTDDFEVLALKEENHRLRDALELMLKSPENEDGTPWINGGMSTVQEICENALKGDT